MSVDPEFETLKIWEVGGVFKLERILVALVIKNRSLTENTMLTITTGSVTVRTERAVAVLWPRTWPVFPVSFLN